MCYCSSGAASKKGGSVVNPEAKAKNLLLARLKNLRQQIALLVTRVDLAREVVAKEKMMSFEISSLVIKHSAALVVTA